MRRTPNVAPQFEFRELRNRHTQGISDAAQPSVARFLGCARELFQKITSEWIVSSPHRAVRFTDQLWDNVQITYRGKEIRDFPEGLINVDLFEIGLCQALGVLLIFFQRPLQQLDTVFGDSFFLDDRT